MSRQHRALGIAFLVIGVANAILLTERPWGIGTGAVFLILGIVFLRRARLERG
jgi:hypothetical protein